MLLNLPAVETATSTPPRALIEDTSSLSNMAKLVRSDSFQSLDSIIEVSRSTELGQGSAMTEIQLALIHGNQKNSSRNIISYFETYPKTALPVIREGWKRVVQTEPIFRTRFDLRNEGRLLEQTSAPFIWNEMDVFSREAYENALHSSASAFQAGDGTTCELMVGHYFDVVTFHDNKSGLVISTIIWRIQHALIDGYSAMLVLQKVRRAIASLPIEPSPSFATLAQNLLRLQEDSAAEGEAFWRQQYANYPSASGGLSLTPPSAGRKDDLDAVSFQVPVPELNLLARSSGVTLATLCYVAWALTMTLYTESNTIVFGAVLSGRNLPLPDVEKVVGPLMNTLPMHVTVDRSLSMADFVRSVFDNLMALMSFQWTLPKHGYSRQFSSAIGMQFDLQVDASTSPVSDLGFVAPLGKPHSETRTDIPISIFIETHGAIRLQYDAALFKKHDMEVLCQHYEAAFSTILQSDALVGECLDQIMDIKARPLLHSMGNCHSSQTSFASAQDDLVLLFDRTVAANPEAIAVEKGDEKITYGALDAAARRIASVLREVTTQGDIIFLHADRTINWIFGIWGILKAGAIYCPVDPALPQAIRNANYESAQAKAFLGCVEDDKSFKPTSCDNFLAVQDILSSVKPGESSLPSRHWAINPQASAYVCFTSGSTGKPKGVICTHAGLVAFQKDHEVRLMARPGWRVAQTMSVAFDGSIHEIFSALTYGATLVLAHSTDMFSHIAEADTTILTPSAAKVLDPDDFPNLKTVYLVGEPVPQEVNDRWSSKKALYNMYGPTEGTGGATIKKLLPGHTVTIGRPNPSTRIYILNNNLSLVPPGAVGEICLAGIQVARGYINLPQQTAERFLPDDICPQFGEMMYRTGDRGYWDITSGEIICLGRQDRQIKLRGFRLDLNDLEVRMLNADLAVTAVALARQDDHLVAMITPGSIDTADYAAKVRNALPVHALPRHIIAINQFPMTTAGKLDYKAISNASATSLHLDVRPKAPLTQTERKLATVWASILGLEDHSAIDRESAFIDLGGHSVLELRLLTKLNQDFHRRFPFKLIIESSTLRAMAEAIDRMLQDTSALPECILERAISTDEHALSPIELEWWDKYQLGQGSSAFSVCFAAHINASCMDRTRLTSAWNKVLARHPILRSRYVKSRRIGVRRLYAECPPQVQRMSELDIWKEANRPFNLAKNDPIRILMSRETLLVVISHIICDLTTFDLLTEEVASLYGGKDLPAVNKKYTDAIFLDTLPAPCHFDFWTNNLEKPPGPETIFEVAADRVSYRGSSMLTEIPLETFHAMLKVVTTQRITLHQYVLAAVALTMQADRDQIDIILGGPHLNRNSPEALEVVGLFLEPLPIRISSTKASLNTAADFIRLVQSSSKQSLANAVPWNQLLQHLGVVIDYPNHPLFDIMVTFHDNHFKKAKALPGLDPVMLWAEGSKFKLMFEFTVVSQDRLMLRIEHDQQCYPTSTVKRIANLLTRALKLIGEPLTYLELRSRIALECT
ncbi:BcNRPS1, nonribosomal peptide synthetase [Phaeosphaeriaceae sp. PMI808]|nr:BcNRPS1, nonribosomal peptide synthetase [Phaeosphaeriaceae sp. PMI808]